MKQKVKCKIKTVLFAIIFVSALSWFYPAWKLMFSKFDPWYLSINAVLLFAIYHSSTKMFKNAFASGWIEFQEEKKMLSFNLNSKESAENLIRLCEKYHDDMEVDIIHGRQTVDGCSLMGVISLLGNFVTVNPHSEEKELIQKFADELERIKC